MKPLPNYVPRTNPLEKLMSNKIHYACGRNVMPGWLNVDGFDESYPYGKVEDGASSKIFHMDLTKAHPFPANSFRFGYAEDFLEHLDQSDAIIFLCECYRTFAPGGVLRLSFPGFEGVLRRHLRSSDYGGGVTCQNEAYTSWWHKHFFSEAELELLVRHIGFRHFQKVNYGESKFPELQGIETRPDQVDLNLVCELTK
jgi:predicted SAM-dependent methyltransferase